MEFITQNFPWLAGISTGIALGWNYVKVAFFHIRSILIRTVSFSSNSNRTDLLLIHKYFKYKYSLENQVRMNDSWINSNRVFISFFTRLAFLGITEKYRPVLVTSSGEGEIKLTFMRGTFNIQSLISYIHNSKVENYNQRRKEVNNKFKIIDKYGLLNEKIKISNNEKNDLQQVSKSPTDENFQPELFLSESNFITGKEYYSKKLNESNHKEQLDFNMYSTEIQHKIKMLIHWVENRQWFNERNIPWNRSIRIEGVPGSGKSTFIFNLAKHLNLPIFKFHLTTMDSKDFQEAWKSVTEESPAIVLLEDFDRLFNEDKSFKLDKLSLDTVLNAISGANEYNGILTIITANFPERLDPALGVIENGKSTRPR